ncbi:hypothetical protein LCGC14_0249500 [marine sediment metagenome]|uniref:Methyltransferase domain-containing protein n=1 Tax=marine sediment metagenome TaxID=412755 RepID=A0A0F9ULR0_9ZZZZ
MNHRTNKLIKVLNDYKINPKMGAEVGVQFGKNAYGMLKTFPDLHLLLVDSYDPTTFFHDRHTAENARNMALVRLFNFTDRTQWFVKTSVEAATEIPDYSLDYAFIDAGHGYDDVRADIAAWSPKIRHGGILAGHDYTRRFRGVVKAVNEAFGGKHERKGDLWWIQMGK